MSDSHISALRSHLTQPSGSTSHIPEDDRDRSDIDDEELFAQLEEEIVNGDAHLREGGLERLQQEFVQFLLLSRTS